MTIKNVYDNYEINYSPNYDNNYTNTTFFNHTSTIKLIHDFSINLELNSINETQIKIDNIYSKHNQSSGDNSNSTETSGIGSGDGGDDGDGDGVNITGGFSTLSWQKTTAVVFFFILIIITIIGNTLIILSVMTTRRLRTVTNCFVMSLAIADWMVGIFVMPPAALLYVYGMCTQFIFIFIYDKISTYLIYILWYLYNK